MLSAIKPRHRNTFGACVLIHYREYICCKKLVDCFVGMAAKTDTFTCLEDLIICPYCSKEFCNPRSLNCQHVYCTCCLEKLASERNNREVKCHECGRVTELKAGGVSFLPPAIQTIRLKEIVEKLIADSAKQNSVSSECVHHPNIHCDLYCHQCDQYVCRDCLLIGEKHSEHGCEKMEDVAKVFCQSFNRELPLLLQKQGDIQKYLEEVVKSKQSLQESCQKACEEISKSYDDIIKIVEEKKKEIIDQFRSRYSAESGLKELNSHAEYVRKLQKGIQSIERRVRVDDESCNESNDLLFMERKKAMLREIRQTNCSINRLPTKPPDHQYNAICPPQLGLGLMESIQEKIPRMYKFVDLSQCTFEVPKGRVNEISNVVIEIKDSNGSPCQLPQCIQVELCSLNNTIEAEVLPISTSRYNAHYKPTLKTRGQCQITVSVNGNVVHQQPVFVECPPDELCDPVHVLKLDSPGCLKTIGGEILVICGEETRYIMKISNVSDTYVSSSMVKAPKKYIKWFPVEIAFSDEKKSLYVTDGHYNMVHMFSICGKYIKSIGGKGRLKGKFNGPNGLCITHDSLYVCDSENHRVQVFDQDLQYSRCFGSKGKGQGKFNWPDNIVFDPNTKHLFVTEMKNNHIQCLTEDGTHMRFIGCFGSGLGKLIKPNILLIVDEHLYVTDDKGVSVFTLSGEFVTQFATECSAFQGKSINGFTIDKEGYRYVSDDARNKIVIF